MAHPKTTSKRIAIKRILIIVGILLVMLAVFYSAESFWDFISKPSTVIILGIVLTVFLLRHAKIRHKEGFIAGYSIGNEVGRKNPEKYSGDVFKDARETYEKHKKSNF